MFVLALNGAKYAAFVLHCWLLQVLDLFSQIAAVLNHVLKTLLRRSKKPVSIYGTVVKIE